MAKVLIRLAAGIIALLMLAPAAQTQQDAQDKALGDVAREQQEARKGQKKATPENIYTDVGGVLEPATADDQAAKPSSSSGTSQEAEDKPSKASASESKPNAAEKAQTAQYRRSVLDQTQSTKPDVIIVPAGTEIRVDVVEGKVIVPVRVGFATPIPALSKAAVQVNPVYFYSGYGAYGTGPVAYVENAVLTAVTVRGVTYAVQANTVQLDSAGTSRGAIAASSPHDATFILSAPLAIER